MQIRSEFVGAVVSRPGDVRFVRALKQGGTAAKRAYAVPHRDQYIRCLAVRDTRALEHLLVVSSG